MIDHVLLAAGGVVFGATIVATIALYIRYRKE